MAKKHSPSKPISNKYLNVAWLASHYRYYLKLNGHVLSKGIPLQELLVLKYPFLLPDAAKPPLLSVDVTDACDLQCIYCNNPFFPYPRTMMSDRVVESLMSQLEKTHINRIRVGGGEPTLHPNIISILKDLSTRTKFLSIVTNGQWCNPEMNEELLRSGLDLIEISVDAGGAEMYESSRHNASYSRLLDNLAALRTIRDKMNSKTMLKVRLMLRPSTLHLEKEETEHLLQYCDCVLPQMLMKHPEIEYDEDVFWQRSRAKNEIPHCSLPFKDLQVRPDGRIPMCPALGCSIYEEKQVFIGNICAESLQSIWKGETMQAIRTAHRTRKGSILETCRNCHYG